MDTHYVGFKTIKLINSLKILKNLFHFIHFTMKNNFENYGLVRKLAWSFAKASHISFDDAFQEAYIGYMKAQENYDPAKGALSTYAWRCIKNHLNNYLKEEKYFIDGNEVTYTPICTETDDGLVYDVRDEYDEPFFENIIGDAHFISMIVIKEPMRFMDKTNDEVDKILIGVMNSLGWGTDKTLNAIHNLREVYTMP